MLLVDIAQRLRLRAGAMRRAHRSDLAGQSAVEYLDECAADLLALADAVVTSPDGRVTETRLGMSRPRFASGTVEVDGRRITVATLFKAPT